jgi:hypothetical protein
MSRLLIALAVVAACGLAHADVIHIPVGEQGEAGLSLPNRGDTTTAVLERFGLADEEHPPVGNPPIRRWDYRYFSVYFENDNVIDSVLHHQRTPPLQQENLP